MSAYAKRSRIRLERRGFLRDGDGRDRIAFGGEHARELRARVARGGLVGEHAVREFVRDGEVESFEREVDAGGEQRVRDVLAIRAWDAACSSAMAVPPASLTSPMSLISASSPPSSCVRRMAALASSG